MIEVQGCFWHAHRCHLFKNPKSNSAFWAEKHRTNKARDSRNALALSEIGLRRLVVWECALKGSSKLGPKVLSARLSEWIREIESSGEITGILN